MLPQSTLPAVIAAVLVIALPATAAQAPHSATKRASDLSLTAQLKLADTAIERYALLPDDSDFVFDFNTAEAPIATSQNFYPLVGTGISFNMGSLPACSMSFVHLHPRATELLTLTSGHVLTEMVPETGVTDSSGNPRVIRTDLHAGQMTIFPTGSFHTQVNPDCSAANFTAAFTSDEFALGMVARQIFEFSDDIIAASFGEVIAGEDIEKVRDAIPTSLAIAVEGCLDKCGKEKRRF
ncbi:RmlC-like cupin domain-containing protein [Aspergillus recurvatus]